MTPYAAYVWYCAGEADLAVDVERARTRLARARQLAEATHASFVAGVAGASKASIDARVGDPHAAAADYRVLIHHWRRAGMWSLQPRALMRYFERQRAEVKVEREQREVPELTPFAVQLLTENGDGNGNGRKAADEEIRA